MHGERWVIDRPVVSCYPQPVALLARPGGDQRHKGQGLGAALLMDVIIRVASLSDAIGCRGPLFLLKHIRGTLAMRARGC